MNQIEGCIRLSDNITEAQKRYGNIFLCKIIETPYFSCMGDNDMIPTLVCNDDNNLVLGKPRHYSLDIFKINTILEVKLVKAFRNIYKVEVVIQ